MSSVFAVTVVGDSSLRESQVVITPTEDPNSGATTLEITVLVFEPAVSASGTNVREMIERITMECRDNPSPYATSYECVLQRSNDASAASVNYQPAMESIRDAHVTVEYLNPRTNSYSSVEGCEDLLTDVSHVIYNATTGEPTSEYYYTATCDITELRETQRRTVIRALYRPDPTDDIRASINEYSFTNAGISGSSEFTGYLNDLIRTISEGGNLGASGTRYIDPLGSNIPCITIFLIAGLLLSSLYFAGKSPISLLDITTPRLPQPKGVAASGQIITPFGYSELTRTAKSKMGATVNAIGATTAFLAGNTFRNNPRLNRLNSLVDGIKGTVAQRAAGMEEARRVTRGIVTGGLAAGIPQSELERLATMLPSNYGDAENRVVASIISRLESMGGRHRLLAMQIADWRFGAKTLNTLGVLEGHPDVTITNVTYLKFSKVMDMAIGPTRYAILGAAASASRGSLVRASRQAGKMGKALFTEAPHLARGVAKTTMEMIGGRHALEDLEARAKTSRSAAWFHAQLTKHPSSIEIGHMFPLNDKMKHLYNVVNDESKRHCIAYLLKRFYTGKFKLKFNLTEEEQASLGHKDVNILARSGFADLSDAEKIALANAEKHLVRILSNNEFTAEEKIQRLVSLIRSEGIKLDDRGFAQMFAFNTRLEDINQQIAPDYVKMTRLQQLLEEQNQVRMSISKGKAGHVDENAFVCHVGGDTLRGHQIWETMVLRTMVWDAENGYLTEASNTAGQAGIREELISARLNIANRTASLDPTSAPEKLPEHMRDATELRKVVQRNKNDLMGLFSEEGANQFKAATGKTMGAASIDEIVKFMYGGSTVKSNHHDKETGRTVWWGCDDELQLNKSATKVDVKRHWVTKLDDRENFAIGQWTESRFTKSYVPAYDPKIEAQLKQMGADSWSDERYQRKAKELWVQDLLVKDCEARFNSHFGHNAYGTTRETMTFYSGIAIGFLEKTLEDRDPRDPELKFLREMDASNAKQVKQLGDMLGKYRENFEKVLSKPVTYEDLATSKKAMVNLHEGGYAYYHKGLMMSDKDRLVNASVCLRDNKGIMREFIAEEVPLQLDNGALMSEYVRVRDSALPEEWDNLMNKAKNWADNGGIYDYDKQKQLAALTWTYSQSTSDYSRFWRNTNVTVESKREVAPAAPSWLRFFGTEGHWFSDKYRHVKNYGYNLLDYTTRVSLIAGKQIINASYDITPHSEQFRRASWRASEHILAERDMEGLTEAERKAYHNSAMQHGAYHQVWDYAIDRHPGRESGSHGAHANFMAGFPFFGLAQPYSVKDNMGAQMDRGEYWNFMAMGGFMLDPAAKIMNKYTQGLRAAQQSMQGTPSRWDRRWDPMKPYNYTLPRMQEALQTLNPFSYGWTSNKYTENIDKLNVFKGSAQHHDLAGPAFSKGLRQAPQDTFGYRKGVYAYLRTGEANPGDSFYNYRHELKLDAAMAEYMVMSKGPMESIYKNDREIWQSAMDNTVPRTISAEALGIRRRQELYSFGIMQNPLYGWANPIAFLWHLPPPGVPDGLAPRDLLSGWVGKAKYGHGKGFADNMNAMVQRWGQGAVSVMQPHKVYDIVYCRCGMSGYRKGGRCRGCGARL